MTQRTSFYSVLIVAFLFVIASPSLAGQPLRPSAEETALARHFVEAKFTEAGQKTAGASDPGGLFSAVPPFSFVYDGKPSAALLGTWKADYRTKKLDAERTAHTVVYTDPAGQLSVRCEAIEYLDFPTVEWTLYFKNIGTTDTPIIENIQALDIAWPREENTEFLLHHNVGSPCSDRDYSPLETPLPANASKRITAAGGRPTNTDLSYFNLQQRPDEGLIVVVGWPGQWAADFVRDADRGIHVRAGQELTHFKLLPKEEVRTPLVVLQFWKGGDWIRSQNIWRRWMIAHNLPRSGGKPPAPMLFGCSSRLYEEMTKADEASQIMCLDRYLEEKIKLDYWWMDAGWYIQNGWPQTGTWEVDAKRFPRGLKPISDHAHARGVKILVWFEPERVAAGTWLADNHPKWIHGGKNGGLLDLGNPDALKWTIEHFDKLITEQGIDLYRQDFNMDPLDSWRAADAPDRQGITEIRHVTGYLAYWDELRRRHPDMLIDSCASGGRRNDLETMRRAVPLWRTDYPFEPIGHQSMTCGISSWIPFHGTGTVACEGVPYMGSGKTPVVPYVFWSNAAPSLNLLFDIRVKDYNYDVIRRLTTQWREISPFYYGDFYPLTECTRQKDDWIAWQFDLPERDSGMVQAFRRPESIYESARLKLRGLEPRTTYQITRLDSPKSWEMSGEELMQKGLLVDLPQQPGAAIVTYRKKT